MDRWPRLINALAVKSVLHLFAIVWVSIIVLVGLFARPRVIEVVGPLYWMFIILPLFILLYMVWISFVILVRRDGRLFKPAATASRSKAE